MEKVSSTLAPHWLILFHFLFIHQASEFNMPAVCSVNAPPISPDVYGFLYLNLSSTIPYHQRAIDPLIIIECKYKRDLYGFI